MNKQKSNAQTFDKKQIQHITFKGWAISCDFVSEFNEILPGSLTANQNRPNPKRKPEKVFQSHHVSGVFAVKLRRCNTRNLTQ